MTQRHVVTAAISPSYSLLTESDTNISDSKRYTQYVYYDTEVFQSEGERCSEPAQQSKYSILVLSSIAEIFFNSKLIELAAVSSAVLYKL